MPHTRWPARRPPGDDGASAVEFALIVPVLIILLFGIINFGAIFGQKLILNQAVREGARAAVVAGTGKDATVPALVQNALGEPGTNTFGIKPEDVVVTGDSCADLAYGDNLKVTASYTTSAWLPMPIPGLDEFSLDADAVFRCEW